MALHYHDILYIIHIMYILYIYIYKYIYIYIYIYSSVLRLLCIIVLNFENEELKYHQKIAFAIGSKFSPPYSNLFIVELKNIFKQ